MSNVQYLDPMQRAKDLATAAIKEQENLMEDMTPEQSYVHSMWDKVTEVIDYQIEALRWQKKLFEVYNTELWSIEARLKELERTPESDDSQTGPSTERKGSSEEPHVSKEGS